MGAQLNWFLTKSTEVDIYKPQQQQRARSERRGSEEKKKRQKNKPTKSLRTSGKRNQSRAERARHEEDPELVIVQGALWGEPSRVCASRARDSFLERG